MKNPVQLCAVIPAYNEAECIEKVVSGWVEKFDQVVGAGSYRLIVVNDGSKDQTGSILDQLAVRYPDLKPLHKPNGGHGDALYVGYREALTYEPEFVFQTDSDDQFKPEDFLKVWEKRDQSKAIFGYRRNRHDPFHRLVITRILRLLVLLAYGVYLKDANVPYRLFRGSYFARLLKAIPPAAFAPNIFLAVLAARDGQNLFFIPITHEERQTGVISIVRWKLIKVCLRSARELIDFRWTLNARLHTLKAGHGPART